VVTDGNVQTRTHNAQNEITGISGAVLPTYDANGNLTRDETGRQFVYDAWNRLVEVRDDSGETVKRYAYDGLHRRISETAGGVITDFYYSDQWQVLEERVGGQTTVQYVWSPVYVDALILRDRDSDGDGTLDQRLWVVQDANFNVTAVVDDSGEVVERYVYDPFGQVTVLDAEWNVRSGGSAYDWFYLHQGGRYDVTSGLYHFRFRDYSPTLGCWTSRDPLSYAAGDVNLYRSVGNGPTGRLDPSGLIFYDWLADRIVNNAPTSWVEAWAGPSVRSEPPSFGVSLIPIYGAANQAEYHLSRGEYGWAIAYTLMSASDVLLIRSLVTGVGRAGWRAFISPGIVIGKVGRGAPPSYIHVGWTAAGMGTMGWWQLEARGLRLGELTVKLGHSPGLRPFILSPVLSARLAIITEIPVLSCITAMINAWSRGNFHLPYFLGSRLIEPLFHMLV